MDNRIDRSTSKEVTHYQGVEPAAKGWQKIGSDISGLTTHNKGRSKVGNTDQVVNRLKNSAARVETVRAALGQIADLLDSVRESVRRANQGQTSPRNLERLLRSASSTAEDIVEHAKFDNENLLGLGNRMSYADRVTDQISLHAISAYSRNAQAFQDAKVDGDPPLVRHAMQTSRAFVSGPEGVLPALEHLASHGPFSAQQADDVLSAAQQTVEGLRNMLADARVRDVDRPLQSMSTPLHKPFDLES